MLNLGVKGEDKLQQALDMHSDEFKVLYNVRLQVNDQSIESDALVFSQTGIYLLEVKNFGSSGKYSITVASDGQWLKCLQNGKKRTNERRYSSN
ncbi:NERD domain-containing protein (plasmid) [Lysinibacillus sp. MHQ-1]|nr:NERD domain-containing protein [Lysinibacillus sp. MHQ-1]